MPRVFFPAKLHEEREEERENTTGYGLVFVDIGGKGLEGVLESVSHSFYFSLT